MSLGQFFVSIAGHHLIPALLASVLLYLVLALLFGPGRLRKPADRALFLYSAPLKAALAVWVGTGLSCLGHSFAGTAYLQIRLPNLVPDGPPFEPHVLAAVLTGSELTGRVLLLSLILALALLCYRWFRLAPFYRRIYACRQASAREFPELVQAYGRRKGFPRPRLMVIRNSPSPAFTMGVRPPIVVLSADMAEALGLRELKGIMAHELAHARRLDYLGRWFATILRDILLWNPFVALWLNRLLEEQEKACDEYAAKLLHDPGAVASGLVETSAYMQRLPVISLGPLAALHMSASLDRLARRVDWLEESARKCRRPAWRTLIVFAVLLAFLAIQPYAAVSLPNLYLHLAAFF